MAKFTPNYQTPNMPKIISYLKNLRDIFYPAACVGCGNSLYREETILCIGCQIDFPINPELHIQNNTAMQTFSGRLPLIHANIYLYFTKNGIAQHAIHALKYEGRQDVGRYLGQKFAEAIAPNYTEKPDLVLPVPLHVSKEKTRGYNQCHSIGAAMSAVFGCELDLKSVSRTVANNSQTTLNRAKRWDNVKDIFALKENHDLAGKHILIVDDTLTTGATIESLGATLLQIPNVKLSVAALAQAQ